MPEIISLWLVASCQARQLKPKLYERAGERQSDQLFSSAVSRLFSSGCESEPIKELSGSSLSPASIPWTFLTPPLFTIKCFVISNLHSTGGGILSLGSGASCPRATTCNSVSVSCYGPPNTHPQLGGGSVGPEESNPIFSWYLVWHKYSGRCK